MSQQERYQVIRNFDGQRRHQYQDEWAKLGPGQVYDMLKECKYSCRSTAQELRSRLRTHRWEIAAAPHAGGHGHGHGGRGPDRNLHVTIRVNGRGYHLRLGGSPTRLHISSITR
jgi:hypothetical protein